MRDDQTSPRVTRAAAAPAAPTKPPDGAPPRSLRWLALSCGIIALAGFAGAGAWWFRSPAPVVIERTPLERLADAESAAIELVADAALPDPALIGSDREQRRRITMVRARHHLRSGSPIDAIELLDQEERAGAVEVDGAWMSLRLQSLRAAGRRADATSESEAWRLSLTDEHPDRAWADAERALDAVVNGDVASAESIVAPWLGRSLSPLPASRLRLVEALVRSAHGDHAVAAAAFDGCVSLDRGLDPRAALGTRVLLDAAIELAMDATTAGDTHAAITLHERALSLAGMTRHRTDLLERYAMLCRTEAMSLIAAARTGSTSDVERVNRRLVDAAASAQEFAARLSTDASGDAPARRAAALFAAADCWERAGRGDEAVKAWRDWLLERPESDPQRAEVLWRVAEMQHGLGRFAEATDAWLLLMKVHANSPQAARAPMAAARALRATNRDDEAAVLLDGVLEGRGGIDPESPSYTAALVERGRLAHARGDATAARRWLDEALRRDPLQSGSLELTILLADAWRLEAIAAAARAAEPGTPSEHQSARRACEHAWNEAARRFAEAVARLDAHEDSATPDSFVAERSAFARLGFASALEATGRLDEAAVAYEETERRHPELEAALVAIDRRRTLPGADNVALRRRAVRRIEGLSDNGRMLSADAWRLWFDAEDSTAPRLAQGAGG